MPVLPPPRVKPLDLYRPRDPQASDLWRLVGEHFATFRQTLPKRLRVHTRFDRKLLVKLCTCVWTCIKAEVQRVLGRDDVVPCMIAAIQTHGEPPAEPESRADPPK